MNFQHPLMQYMPQAMQQQHVQPQQPKQPQIGSGLHFNSPQELMQAMSQAASNPVAFVKQQIPGIPDNVAQDPNTVLQYMMQNFGVTQMDIQNAANSTRR